MATQYPLTRLPAYRKALRLSQCEVARRMGVSAKTIKRWEKGSHPPTLEHLFRLCALLTQEAVQHVPPCEIAPVDLMPALYGPRMAP